MHKYNRFCNQITDIHVCPNISLVLVNQIETTAIVY
jgi:hypothetical protein